MRDQRPICAIATAPGQGAIGVVRVSAPRADIIEAMAQAICGVGLTAAGAGSEDKSSQNINTEVGTHFESKGKNEGESAVSGIDTPVLSSIDAPADAISSREKNKVSERSLKPRFAHYGPFLAADGQPIDYGLALWFAAPHSYTGEHVLELQGHGGPVVQQLILRRMMEVGANFDIRLAEPGEFTERAFLNDKLDLVQAEAVADLIEASTEQAARSATRSLQGVFSGQVDVLAEQLLHLRMLVEATLDFPEEEIEFLQKADAAGQLDAIETTLRQLFGTARSGARLRQGLNVVLTGAPNVGKSSLLNALAGAEVAIVTPIAGTTRDRVIEQISIEGVPINLIDTAGLRDTDDVVERIGIERTWAEIEKADVVVHLRAADSLNVEERTALKTGRLVPSAPGSLSAEHLSLSDEGTGADSNRETNDVAEARAEKELIQAIDARVPPSTRKLTVINKIDLVNEPVGADHSTVSSVSAVPISAGATASNQDNSTDGQPSVPSSTTGQGAEPEEVLLLSAKTGTGIEAFRSKLLDIAGFQPGAEGVFIARERHLQALTEALQHLQQARTHVAHGDQSLDLFAEELRLAHHALGRITGAVSADELLGVIFSRFCIGK